MSERPESSGWYAVDNGWDESESYVLFVRKTGLWGTPMPTIAALDSEESERVGDMSKWERWRPLTDEERKQIPDVWLLRAKLDDEY
jgi:hypothetical protein